MKFCPRCGSLMMLRVVEDKKKWVCPSCGFSEEAQQSSSSSVNVLKHEIRHNEKERIVVISQDKKPEALPKTRAICPRCGHQEAYYWVVQTRRADEPPTRFFRCVKCGYVWREYD